MNYLPKVLKMAKEIIDPNNPQIYHIRVFHDDWCDIFKNGLCNCNPEVKILPQDLKNKTS